MQQQRNFLIFCLVAFALLLGASQLKQRLWPPPEKKEDAEAEVAKPREAKKAEAKKDDVPLAKLPAQSPITRDEDLIPLGNEAKDSAYHLYLLLDPRGAGVRTIVLNK